MALETLTSKEREVIRLRYGVDGVERCHTFREITSIMNWNVCIERIRQIKTKALRKLVHPSRSSLLFNPSGRELKNKINELEEKIENIEQKLKNVPKHTAIGEIQIDGRVIQNLDEKDVNELEFSVRLQNCLRGANIKTVGQLLRTSDDRLLILRNFGKKCLSEIKEVLFDFRRGYIYYYLFINQNTQIPDKNLHLFLDCPRGYGCSITVTRQEVFTKAQICRECLTRKQKEQS